MRKIDGICGSHGKLDGQPALGREADYVDNFPDTEALGDQRGKEQENRNMARLGKRGHSCPRSRGNGTCQRCPLKPRRSPCVRSKTTTTSYLLFAIQGNH